MLTSEDIRKANALINSVDIKGKAYAMVNDRIRAFRSVCPGGGITTEIVAMENGIVTMKSTVIDEDGRILGTGYAQEKESSSFINKTSYVENCETSAVGRALGMCGIGIEDSVASAEELVNAIRNQNKPTVEYASETERKMFFARCAQLGADPTAIMKQAGWKGGRMTVEHHGKALIILKEIEDEQAS